MNLEQIEKIVKKVESGKLSPASESFVEANACLHTAGWNTWVLDEVAELKARAEKLSAGY